MEKSHVGLNLLAYLALCLMAFQLYHTHCKSTSAVPLSLLIKDVISSLWNGTYIIYLLYLNQEELFICLVQYDVSNKPTYLWDNKNVIFISKKVIRLDEVCLADFNVG